MLEDSPVSSSNGDLPMDETESTRRLKELTSLLKKGKWTYFRTITCNDNETPGVREITRGFVRSHVQLNERQMVMRKWRES